MRKSSTADARFHFFNPDGTVAEMCGNGIRCFAKYLHDRGLVRKREMRIETLAGVKVVSLRIAGGAAVEATVGMGAPQVRRGEAQVSGDPGGVMVNEKLVFGGLSYGVTAVGMGNPHAVVFVDDVDAVDVPSVGRIIRSSKTVFPNGVNVHFVQSSGVNEFRIRTYERGVEGETLACGTGICASAVAAVLNGRADAAKPLMFHARGGDIKIALEMEGHAVKAVYLTGPAETVFEGAYDYVE